MYSAVPPPGCANTSVSRPSTASGEDKSQEQQSKPQHVHEHQWKKFLELRERREKEVSTGSVKRTEVTRKKTLRNVSQQLSDTDREILREEGVSLPRAGKRKRRRPERETEGQGKVDSRAEAEWREVRDLMDPNPQLNGVALGKYAPKSHLEEEMDECIERGDFVEAVEMSQKLAKREFSSKVTTAFECREYLKRKKVCVWARYNTYPACNLCFRLKRRERGSENRLNWTGGLSQSNHGRRRETCDLLLCMSHAVV